MIRFIKNWIEKRRTVAKVRERLNALVYEELYEGSLEEFFLLSGIKGIPENSASCPVARYLRIGLPEYWFVYAYTDGIVLSNKKTGSAISFDTPAEITEFIQDFDSGAFPELIA